MFTTPIYNLRGIDEAVKKLGFRITRLQSFRSPLEMIRTDFFELQKGWMDSEGRGSWSPLRPRYLKWKISKVGDKPILQFSGAMYDDVTGQSSGGTNLGPTSLTVRAVKSGTRWTYHERGLSTGNKSGRARPRRKVLSPALYIRKAHWNRLLRDWAAGAHLRRVR
jgi:hypothetical protein